MTKVLKATLNLIRKAQKIDECKRDNYNDPTHWTYFDDDLAIRFDLSADEVDVYFQDVLMGVVDQKAVLAELGKRREELNSLASKAFFSKAGA